MLAGAAVVVVVAAAMAINASLAEKPVTGAPMALRCIECGNTLSLRTADPAECECSQCQNQMGHRVKCASCGTEFAYLPPTEEEADDSADEDADPPEDEPPVTCPKCNATDVTLVSAPEEGGAR